MYPLAPEFDPTLLSRVEDAGLNASAPAEQRWVDGWLLRYAPGKAKRARCINAVAPGRLAVERRLAICEAVFREAGLPMVVRITPFTQPPDLDAQLDALGMTPIDDTRVMVLGSLLALPAVGDLPLPHGWCVEPCAPGNFARVIGALRGSTAAQCTAHAQRLQRSPVPCQPFVLRDPDRPANDDSGIVAGGVLAREAELAGLYDVFTMPAYRGRGLATAVCGRLLDAACRRGAQSAYLQVEADNVAARTVYRRLGFSDGYGYHYRTR